MDRVKLLLAFGFAIGIALLLRIAQKINALSQAGVLIAGSARQ
jgi:hypothetical protein